MTEAKHGHARDGKRGAHDAQHPQQRGAQPEAAQQLPGFRDMPDLRGPEGEQQADEGEEDTGDDGGAKNPLPPEREAGGSSVMPSLRA